MPVPLKSNVLTGIYHICSFAQQSSLKYATMTANVEILSEREIVIRQVHENVEAFNTVHRSHDGGETWVLE